MFYRLGFTTLLGHIRNLDINKINYYYSSTSNSRDPILLVATLANLIR